MKDKGGYGRTNTMPTKTEAQKKAQRKYMENVATIQIRTTADQRDTIKAHAEARGESVNGFINRAISETMERDNGAPAASEEG